MVSKSAVALVCSAAVFTAGVARSQCGLSWDTTIGVPGFNSTLNAFAVFDDGTGPSLYAGGVFTQAGGVPASYVARWTGTAWAAVGVGGGPTGPVQALATFNDGTGPALFAGGAGGTTKWNGVAWSPFAAAPGTINTLAVHDHDGPGPLPPVLVAGGGVFVGIPGFVAYWNGTGWVTLASPSASGMAWPTITGIASWTPPGGVPTLFVTGIFNTIGGTAAINVAGFSGSTWSPLGSGLPSGGYRLAVFDDGTGPALYAAGYFTSAGGVPANRIARWNGTAWSAVGAGVGGTAFGLVVAAALESFDDGSGPALYVGGNFTTGGGAPGNGIARWDGSAWSTIGSGLGGGPNYTAYALASFDDGSGASLFVGGNITVAGGSASQYVARWRASSPAMSLTQPGGPGSGCFISPSGLVAGREYYDILSLAACAGAPGSGPLLGLCAINPGLLFAQFALPVGTLPFHFIATAPSRTFGPYPGAPGAIVDGLCFDFTGGALGCVSPVRRLTIQ